MFEKGDLMVAITSSWSVDFSMDCNCADSAIISIYLSAINWIQAEFPAHLYLRYMYLPSHELRMQIEVDILRQIYEAP